MVSPGQHRQCQELLKDLNINIKKKKHANFRENP